MGNSVGLSQENTAKTNSDTINNKNNERKKSETISHAALQGKVLALVSHQNFDSYSPAICVDFLKSPSLKFLSSLNKKLRQNKKDWNNEFLELQGFDILLDLVDSLESKRVSKLTDVQLLLECVGCIKSLLNSKLGVQYFVQHSHCLKKLVKGKSVTLLFYS